MTCDDFVRLVARRDPLEATAAEVAAGIVHMAACQRCRRRFPSTRADRRAVRPQVREVLEKLYADPEALAVLEAGLQPR